MNPRVAPFPKVEFAKTFGRFARSALRMRLGLGPLVNVRALTRVAACLERSANTPTRNIAKAEVWVKKKAEVKAEGRDVSRWFIYLRPALRASSAYELHHSIADRAKLPVHSPVVHSDHCYSSPLRPRRIYSGSVRSITVYNPQSDTVIIGSKSRLSNAWGIIMVASAVNKYCNNRCT